MNTHNQQSQTELPSPILDNPQKRSKSSVRKQLIQDLEDSESISQKDDNQLLENLSKIQNKRDKNVAQSLYVDREWHPVDYKSDIFADNLRSDNINQSTEIDIETRESGKDKNNHRKPNPLDQPVIGELQDSQYLEQSQMKQSKILRKSLHRIKQNKEKQWIEPNFDIFDDPEIDESPQVIKNFNKQRKNSITVNYVEKKQQENPNVQQGNGVPAGLGAALINMMNSVRANTQSTQQRPPNNNFLHPQMNANYQRNNMQLSFHPNPVTPPQLDNFINPMAQTQHFHSQFPQNTHPINPPTPRSEAGWNTHRPQTPPQSSYQQPHHLAPFPGYEIMNEIRFLREDVKMLREQWKEDRTERLIQRLESKLKSQSRQILRERKGSDSYDKSILSFERRNLLEEQQKRHQRRMHQMQLLFMDKIHRLQKQQRSLKQENSVLRKRSMFKHTQSRQIDQSTAQFQFGSKSGRLSKRKNSCQLQSKKSVNLQQKADEFLKDKLSFVMKQSPVKKPVHKGKKAEPKAGKNVKKFGVY